MNNIESGNKKNCILFNVRYKFEDHKQVGLKNNEIQKQNN